MKSYSLIVFKQKDELKYTIELSEHSKKDPKHVLCLASKKCKEN